MSGLTWLNDLMVWLARWVPRLTLIKAGNSGVMFGLHGSVQDREPGLRFWWPITQDLKIVSTRVRTTEVATQLHGSEAISLVMLFRIRTPKTTLMTLDDVFSVIDDRTQAHLSGCYRPGIDSQQLCLEVFNAMRDEFDSYGVDIEAVDIAQRGFIIPIKMLSDYAQHAVSTLEGGQRVEPTP